MWRFLELAQVILLLVEVGNLLLFKVFVPSTTIFLHHLVFYLEWFFVYYLSWFSGLINILAYKPTLKLKKKFIKLGGRLVCT